MKVLFIGPLLDISGFAHASRMLLKTLSHDENIDVVARSIQYDQADNGKEVKTPEWMQELLHKDLMDVDIAIQMTTCNIEANPVPNVLNVLYTFLRQTKSKRNGLIRRMSLIS